MNERERSLPDMMAELYGYVCVRPQTATDPVLVEMVKRLADGIWGADADKFVVSTAA